MQEMPFFKFTSALIDSGIWAQLSPAARTLYPVLLRFSDRHYKPVYPGSQLLLKLTGFKQKSSLRKARKELVDMRLVSITSGTGRRNTLYHFRFDWGDTLAPPSGLQKAPAGERKEALGGAAGPPGGESGDTPPYNQIHISINNHVQDERVGEEEKKKQEFLTRRFGGQAVELALSECRLAGLPTDTKNLEQILYRGEPQVSWSDVRKNLAQKISRASFQSICDAFRTEQDGVLFFVDCLPEYLKLLLRQLHPNVFFEPREETDSPECEQMASEGSRQQFWKTHGANL